MAIERASQRLVDDQEDFVLDAFGQLLEEPTESISAVEAGR